MTTALRSLGFSGTALLATLLFACSDPTTEQRKVDAKQLLDAYNWAEEMEDATSTKRRELMTALYEKQTELAAKIESGEMTSEQAHVAMNQYLRELGQ